MGTPNLDALVGPTLAAELVSRAGGLLALSKLSDTALRMLGTEEFHTGAASARARRLHAGLLVTAPLFADTFGSADEADAADLKAAQKAAAQLGRKCALVAKADLAGAAPDGALGDSERVKLLAAFARLLAEGKVAAEDTQALAVPFVYVRGEVTKHKRGGVQERRKREAQQEPTGVVERATQRVRLGVSEEVQLAQLLQREDIRSEFAKEREQQLLKESRKRARAAAHDEYDDLQNISL
ncbi:putative snoRNA binding domain containing protein [Novymonas esmeraldas]|uniref:SnoRNA binding domain containing protein n=1 Tax=Novymonas esmeraldas TaxID=1808958 RepID=A0AAW0ENF3_9TRYP